MLNISVSIELTKPRLSSFSLSRERSLSNAVASSVGNSDITYRFEKKIHVNLENNFSFLCLNRTPKRRKLIL